MDHNDVPNPVGVSILFRGAAMRSPPGVSDADRTRQLFSCQGHLQILQLSGTPPDPDLLPLDKGDPCRVISPVLKPLEPVNQYRDDILIPYIANDATHIFSPNPEIESTFSIFLSLRERIKGYSSSAFLFFLFSAHPSMFLCSTRLIASAPGGTSFVTVEPAAITAPSPIFTGATNCVSLPTKTLSPIMVLCFFHPS